MNNIKYEYTKTPLDYQMTEYDCGTTTLLNALRYLFKRSEISPEIYKYIMQYTLDQTNSFGEIGKGGTSVNAMEFLCEWLNINANSMGMNIKCTSIQKDNISIYNPDLQNKINEGAVAIVRVFQDCEHYCLLTRIDEDYAFLFDPYYLNINYYDDDNDVDIIKDRPFEFNRKVKKERMEDNTAKDFALVKNNGVVNNDITLEALERLKVDYLGLDNTDHEYLLAIINKFNGGPVGIEAIASSINEEVTTLEDVCEPYLLQIGLIKRTSRGRVATDKAYTTLGIEK